MERSTELILRNRDRIQASDILVINPASDSCAAELAQAGHGVRLFTQEIDVYHWHDAAGNKIEFGIELGASATGSDAPALIIVYLPREKARLKMLLHLAGAHLRAEGVVWLVGENRAGIKSAPAHLARLFEQVDKLDAARHCVLYAARRPSRRQPFRLEDWFETWNHPVGTRELSIASLPGVFAHGRLDAGTALLLLHLPVFESGQRILDFGCGAGVIGLSILAANPALDLSLLDSSAMAVESTKRSLAINNLHADVLASDGFSGVDGSFDWIISNPPFHRGVGTDYDITGRFISDTARHLHLKGNIMLVANRHLPYEKWLRESYRRVDIVATNKSFKLLLAGGKYNR